MALTKSFCLAIVLFLSISISLCEAREFVVGGKDNPWDVPSSIDDFNKWAEKNRFEIGDTIVMKYDSKEDSVLQVNEEDYKKCDTSNPIKSYKNGHTKIKLKKSGPYFFISGAEGHCKKGQKLEIKVLSAKHALRPSSPVKDNLAPAPAPHNGGSMATFSPFVAVVVGLVLALF